ncbi:MAG TPA: hypothetical protein VKA46_27875 [Gemmataceae bacterium]|nr:hypothetical protein [Gemmataceae bacterium]
MLGALDKVDGEAEALEVVLRSRLHGQVRDLRVKVCETGLVLRGSSPSYYAKQIAQHELMRLSSLPIQANEIEVF